jgi:hypothetical protein
MLPLCVPAQEGLLRTLTTYSYTAYAATHVNVWRIDRVPLYALLAEFPPVR